MAFPFGNHPTLHEYIGWANQQGCTTKSGVMGVDGKMVTYHLIVAPNGRHLIVSGPSMSERLLPRTVAYYDRRLGLDSPFSKLGSGGEMPDQ